MARPSFFNPTLEQVQGARENNVGFCRTCGQEHDGCEPDAENYECRNCGTFSVYGAEEFLIRGWMAGE